MFCFNCTEPCEHNCCAGCEKEIREAGWESVGDYIENGPGGNLVSLRDDYEERLLAA